MRIRNRKVPFPLSSLSPVPLSDPVVQLQHNHRYEEDDTDDYFDVKPSDQYSNGPIRAVDGGAQQQKILEENKSGDGEKSNDSRKESLLGAEILGNMALQQTSSPSSHPVSGRWFEGERAFPLKKKRGSNDKRSSVKEETRMEKDKKMKTKVNKKCSAEKEAKVQGDEEEESKDGIESAITSASSTSAKRKGRGGALMEGSRCSRVNGRGWRCCQQTLVGYSLCEHHLGKGRLRSMNSVRKRSIGSNNGGTLGKKDDKSSSQLSSNPSLSLQEKEMKLNTASDHQVDNDAQEDDQDQDEKPLMMNNAKKKMKLGVVKARSISSLLGQANNAGIAVGAENNE